MPRLTVHRSKSAEVATTSPVEKLLNVHSCRTFWRYYAATFLGFRAWHERSVHAMQGLL